MLQNAYILAKIGADTAENERNSPKFFQKWQLPYGMNSRRSNLNSTSGSCQTTHPGCRRTREKGESDLWGRARASSNFVADLPGHVGWMEFLISHHCLHSQKVAVIFGNATRGHFRWIDKSTRTCFLRPFLKIYRNVKLKVIIWFTIVRRLFWIQ